MRIGENAGKLPFLHGDSSAAEKSSEQKKSAVTDILNRAVEVYISAKGKSLSESADMEEDLTPAEMALAANEKEIADKKAKKAQAAEIEKRIQTDAELTDEDKAKLQKQADELKRAGMTDEDKLSELHGKVDALEKLVKDGFAIAQEIEEPVKLYNGQINQLKSTMAAKDEHIRKLRGQALQERADRDAEITKAQEKERAALAAVQPDDMTALAALREYQKTAAAKKHADRGTVVVPTNKNTSDT
ncbi:hypothetical protein HMPREF9081_0017 [Centipeda periodontii DSM 2778]|uniref:Uncharacterized protein n=1 Tax=Centipeda periodontii DSM 2778 TaxID=888060 RepID=F5RID2_9FIRM|nr:hypothetical protein [Centipeda periodontii]EGK62735.1 hypothetical protein HMPREF9081_0017 [Centipeda periodontii DSM 2778]